MSAILTALLQPRIISAIKSTTAKNAAIAADESLASTEIIQQQFVLELSQAIASAVQQYLLTSVTVTPTALTVSPGIPVTSAGPTGPVIGATTAPGPGITAIGKLAAP